MNVIFTEKYLRAVILNVENLRREAAEFVEFQEKGNGSSRSVYVEDISFNPHSKEVIWSYEKNTSCHCHPTYETVIVEHSFEDFIKWINERKPTIEQFTEAEIDW